MTSNEIFRDFCKFCQGRSTYRHLIKHYVSGAGQNQPNYTYYDTVLKHLNQHFDAYLSLDRRDKNALNVWIMDQNTWARGVEAAIERQRAKRKQ